MPNSSERDLAPRVAEAEDRYKRARAELDNYRKRSAREADRRVAERIQELMRDWLEVVDGIEQALREEPPGTALSKGLHALLEQMETILATYGVGRVGAVGESFDPERHEAVGERTTDTVPQGTVVEVTRSGFQLGDRILRPAQVIVARRPEMRTDLPSPSYGLANRKEAEQRRSDVDPGPSRRASGARA